MQQETNTSMKGIKSNNHAQNFLINTKKHPIPELALSNAEWNEQTQPFIHSTDLNQFIF